MDTVHGVKNKIKIKEYKKIKFLFVYDLIYGMFILHLPMNALTLCIKKKFSVCE